MRSRGASLGVLTGLLLAVSACGNAGDRSERAGSDDADAADPAPTAPVSCPDRLAEAEGVPPPAEVEAPTWPELTEGVLCTYTLGERGWDRRGDAKALPAAALAEVRDQVGSLAPVTPDQMCTMDMGPRHLLVAASDEGTLALVVEDFGCHDALFTSDPAGAPAGESGTTLAPMGRFGASPELLELMGATT